MVIAVAVGALIGLSLGALGGGGSILTVPALVYLLGQEAKDATTGSLVIVGLTSLIALIPHARAGRVRFVQGLLFGVLGIAGSFAGSALAAHVAAAVLLGAFSVLMLVVSVLMLRRSAAGGASRGETAPAATPIVRWRPFRCDWTRALRLVVTASAVGLLTGFFGVGGGFALVPALVLALGFAMPVAVGTSLLVISVNSASALLARLGQGISLDWGVIAVFTGAAIVASLLGGRLAARLPAVVLTRAFAILLIVVALGVGAETLLG